MKTKERKKNEKWEKKRKHFSTPLKRRKLNRGGGRKLEEKRSSIMLYESYRALTVILVHYREPCQLFLDDTTVITESVPLFLCFCVYVSNEGGICGIWDSTHTRTCYALIYVCPISPFHLQAPIKTPYEKVLYFFLFLYLRLGNKTFVLIFALEGTAIRYLLKLFLVFIFALRSFSQPLLLVRPFVLLR